MSRRPALALAFLYLVTPAAGAQEEAERAAMHDRALRWSQHVRFARVVPSWLEGVDAFRFRGMLDGGERTLVVDCESGAIEQDPDPSWPEVPAPATSAPVARGGSVPSPQGNGTVSVRNGALFLASSAGERMLAEGEPEYGWTLADEPWSPDGRHVAALRSDVRDVYHIPVQDYSDAIPTTRLVPYAKSGDAFPRLALCVFDVEDGEALSIDLGEGDFYLQVEGWRLDGSELLVHRTSRDAKKNELLAVASDSGAVRSILTEESETFVGGLEFFLGSWRDVYVPLEDGRRFLWRSERDGWAHLYLYEAEGELLGRLTAGELPVERVLAVDEEGGQVYYYAPTTGRPYDRHLWRVSLDGGEPQQLTEAAGRHEVTLAPSFGFFVDTHSSVARPYVSELRSMEGGPPLVLARADVAALEQLGLFPGEPFVAKAADGETDLYGMIYVPYDFDASKSYPVVDYIYGGPFLSVVQHDYGQDYMPNAARALAQLGYVVFMVDARGTPGRSKAFQDANYGIIGQVVAHDHAAVLRELAATRPFMDTERVGIIGASWGGYFVVKAIITEPETFHVAVAIVPGDLTEESTINEPNMGLPADNPEGYRIGSITHEIESLQGKLMLAHGTSDVNAPISTSMRVASALIEAGMDFEFLVLPGQGHGFRGASQRWFELRRDRFLREHLGGLR